jgi:hypothetical protein
VPFTLLKQKQTIVPRTSIRNSGNEPAGSGNTQHLAQPWDSQEISQRRWISCKISGRWYKPPLSKWQQYSGTVVRSMPIWIEFSRFQSKLNTGKYFAYYLYLHITYQPSVLPCVKIIFSNNDPARQNYRWRNWGKERLCYLLVVTSLPWNSTARIQKPESENYVFSHSTICFYHSADMWFIH